MRTQYQQYQRQRAARAQRIDLVIVAVLVMVVMVAIGCSVVANGADQRRGPAVCIRSTPTSAGILTFMCQ